MICKMNQQRLGSVLLPEHRLDIDDGLGVRHVVLLGAHRALFVHHHQVVSVDDSTLEQVVQTGPDTNKDSQGLNRQHGK